MSILLPAYIIHVTEELNKAKPDILTDPVILEVKKALSDFAERIVPIHPKISKDILCGLKENNWGIEIALAHDNGKSSRFNS